MPVILKTRSLLWKYDQARHDDLRSVIDDHSNMSLIERMKKAIAVAKERETEKV